MMCGIIGQIGGSESDKWVRDGLDTIRHRGPDDKGLHEVQVGGIRATLGHARLSILDLSELAHQPMTTPDGRYTIIYNGEVYNFPELRAELAGEGEHISSTGDTEVILRACAKWGVSAASARFNGMFAFALFDNTTGETWLVRDPMGIKPLFFSHEPTSEGFGRIRFASELKVFGLANAGIDSILAMLLGTPVLTGSSPWRNVREVLPGTTVHFSPSHNGFLMQETRWFGLDRLVDIDRYQEYSRMDFKSYSRMYRDKYLDSVRRHLLSDAPMAIGLSGGLDSTLVLAAAKELGCTLLSYHANVQSAESAFAEMAANSFGSTLVSILFDPEMFAENLAELTWFNDYPLAYHTNSAPFALMCQRASQDVKVLLTGEGADELMFGYGWPENAVYTQRRRKRVILAQRVLRRLKMRGLASRLNWIVDNNQANIDNYYRFRMLVSGGARKRWESCAADAYAELPDTVNREIQKKYLATAQGHLQSLLWRNDRMGMLAGIESRFPFLDRELLAVQVNTPVHHKLRGRLNKAAEREAARLLGVPKKIWHRPKFAFDVNPSAYCGVEPAFFRDGFLEQYFPYITQMDQKADWDVFYFYFIAVEVWGRLFCRGESRDCVREHIMRYSK